MNHRFKKWVGLFLLFLLILTGVFLFYVSDPYEPSKEAIDALASTSQTVVTERKGYYAFLPEAPLPDTGLIFYQGGKVEEQAYAPLMKKLAEKGIPSFLLELPFNLAVLNPDAAQKVIEKETNIHHWFLAGHSLGGVMASSFAAKHPDQIHGLIFLASYPASDLTKTGIPSLSIYADHDEVLNQDEYTKALKHLPFVKELILKGGNHGQFGSYGKQKGDGTAQITAEEQQTLTADAIEQFIKEKTLWENSPIP